MMNGKVLATEIMQKMGGAITKGRQDSLADFCDAVVRHIKLYGSASINVAGTGWVHVTDGTLDSDASTPNATDVGAISLSVMTNKGDTIYGDSSGTPTRLPPPSTVGLHVLSNYGDELGEGGITPIWKVLAPSDIGAALDSLVMHLAGNETATGVKTFSNDTTTEPLIVSSANALGTGFVINTDTATANGVLAFKRSGVRKFNLGIGNANGYGNNTFFLASGDLSQNWLEIDETTGRIHLDNLGNNKVLATDDDGWMIGISGSFSDYQLRSEKDQASGYVGRGADNAAVLPGSVSASTLRVGFLEAQSFGLDNCWMGTNAFYNGTQWTRRNESTAQWIAYFNTGIEARVAVTGAAGSAITGDKIGWRVANNGHFYAPQHASIANLATDADGQLIAGSAPLTPPTGTGWIHVTSGSVDGAASTPTYSDVGAEPSGAVSTHAGLTTGVHGVGASTIASTLYVDTLFNSLAGRIGAGVDDLTALRALNGADQTDKEMRLVESLECHYWYDTAGTGADDGNFVIVPHDITPPAPGRWFKGQSATQTHNALIGLQGGTAGEYNHLTNAQVSALHAAVTITGLPLTLSGQQIGISVGTTSTSVAAGDDSRFTNSRTPTAHQLDGALHTVSGLTPGHFLKALTDTTFGFAAHGLDAAAVGAAASGAATGSGLTMATARLLGRTTATAGAIEEISVSTGLSLTAGVLSCTVSGGMTNPMVGVGDIIRGGAAGAPTNLAAPTTNGNYLLTSLVTAGAAVAPSWVAASQTGGASTIVQADANSDLATLGNLLMTKSNTADTTIDRLRLKYDANWEFAIRQKHVGGSHIEYGIWLNHSSWTNPVNFGSFGAGSINLPYMTALTLAAYDANKCLTSVAYSQTGAPSSIPQLDSNAYLTLGGSANCGIFVGKTSAPDTNGAAKGIQVVNQRNDGNGSFGGRLGLAHWRSDGTAIGTGTVLGFLMFGGPHTGSTTYTDANNIYTAGVWGMASEHRTDGSHLGTDLVFSTLAKATAGGMTAGQVNAGPGTEKLRLTGEGILTHTVPGTASTQAKASLQASLASGAAISSWIGTAISVDTAGYFAWRHNTTATDRRLCIGLGGQDPASANSSSLEIGRTVVSLGSGVKLSIGSAYQNAPLSFSATTGLKAILYDNNATNTKSGFGVDMSGAPYEHSSFCCLSGDGVSGHFSWGTYNGTTYAEKMSLWENGLLRLTAPSTATLPTLGTATGSLSLLNSTNQYGLYAGVVDSSGNAWLQVMRNNTAVAYDLVLQPVGGSVIFPGLIQRTVAGGSAAHYPYFVLASTYQAAGQSNDIEYRFNGATPGARLSFVNRATSTDIDLVGYGGGALKTIMSLIGDTGTVNIPGLTASRPVATDASKNLVSLAAPVTSGITSNLTMTTGGDSYLGGSITVGAGVWSLSGNAHVVQPSTSGYMSIRISNGSTNVCLNTSAIAASSSLSMALSPVIVTVASSTTFYLYVLSSINGATLVGDTGSGAGRRTWITAVQIA